MKRKLARLLARTSVCVCAIGLALGLRSCDKLTKKTKPEQEYVMRGGIKYIKKPLFKTPKTGQGFEEDVRLLLEEMEKCRKDPSYKSPYIVDYLYRPVYEESDFSELIKHPDIIRKLEEHNISPYEPNLLEKLKQSKLTKPKSNSP